ncbi:MAG TPA: Ldh family oxidoreductase, partial [Solirubrobacteraceae bacterium]|nr:Ldh family oxidoreductase [Solirubrobacteraceae bacterium]
LSARAARTVAAALVDSDMRGVGSHGVMLVPMYLDRLRAGSVSGWEEAEVVDQHGAITVLDARHALGQLTGDQAMGIAVARAREYGAGVTVVRHAFHFGGAYRYALAAARAGCIGIAAANTRPLMPAPGGAEAVVGNNPLAIAAPVAGGAEPIVLDMALSEAALGKIRLAAQEGREIPSNWAVDADGRPTTDPEAAIAGLLLPIGLHKGYGLALMVDVLTGVLAGGGFGRQVNGLYADVAVPNDAAHLFIALDLAAFGSPDAFTDRVAALAAEVTGAARAPAVERVYLPGELAAERRAAAARDGVALDPGTVEALSAAGVAWPESTHPGGDR